MKTTVFESIHKSLGAKMVSFAGYSMPVEYSGVNSEHLAVRNAVGVFDVSHMGVFWIKGKGALSLIQKVTTNDMAALKTGRSIYSCMTLPDGGIIDDIIVYRYSDDKYFVVANASNVEKDWQWLSDQNTFGADLQNASDELSLLAVQGPRALEVLQKLTPADLSALGRNALVSVPMGDAADVIVSSTGYTGSGGVELLVYNQDAVALWNRIFEAGAAYGIVPAGLAARDTLRLEMGYCLYGNDIDEHTTPLEAGLGWTVKWSEGNDFVGRSALEKQKNAGITRSLVGLELLDRGIPRHHYIVTDLSGSPVGAITSGTMSPSLKKGIGMAYVPVALSAPGTELCVEIRGRLLRAVVVTRPFQ